MLKPLADLQASADATVIQELWQTILERRASRPTASHSARLLAKGRTRMAQKLGEEVVECAIAALGLDRRETVLESADVIYHLVALWVDLGIQPQEIWNALTQRGDLLDGLPASVDASHHARHS
ncbi:phosphoribosyl-ATP diphosphatase [Neoroseomonas terrae]|uniref:phosphoribosyl-ATP diphosphatase n=1 Tax=Neoroseomonas terrae TaxID=424799 RepID=UPI001FEBD5A1|nr:phosphoribosyl-ATP diphosphatase [Neoroseomonas terrae]